MKKIFFIIATAMFMSVTLSAQDVVVNTNTTLTMANVSMEVADVKLVVGDWKEAIEVVQTTGFTLSVFLTILLPLLLLSIIILSTIIIMIFKLIAIFTPDEVDIKLQKAEVIITKYGVKLPITILNKVKNTIKKK